MQPIPFTTVRTLSRCTSPERLANVPARAKSAIASVIARSAAVGVTLMFIAASLPRAAGDSAGELLAPLGEDRKVRQHIIERGPQIDARAGVEGAKFEILQHRHERKEASALGDHDQTAPNHIVRCELLDRLAVEPN